MAAGTLGSLVLEMGANIAKLREDMGKSTEVVTHAVEEMVGKVEFLEAAFHRVAEVATVGGLAELAHKALESADAIGKAAAKAGTLVDEYQKLSVAATLADTDTGTLVTGLKQLEKSAELAAGGAKKQGELFRALGIDIKAVGTGADASVKTMYAFADAIAGLRDAPALQVATAMGLMGRAGNEMLPVLRGGSEELKRFAELSEKLGLVLSEGTIKSAESFNDSVKVLGLVIQGLGNRLLTEIAGPLATVGKVMEEAAINAVEMNKASLDLARPELINWGDTVARLFAFIGDAATNVVKIFGILAEGVQAAFKVVGIGAAGIAAQMNEAFSFTRNTQGLAEMERQLEEDMRAAVQPVRDAISSLANGPTLGQALEKALSLDNKAGESAAEGVRKATEDQIKRIQAALADNNSAANAAKLEQEYLNDLNRRLVGEKQITEEARVRYDLEQGKGKAFSDTTKAAAINAAQMLDVLKEGAAVEKGLTDQATEELKLQAELLAKQKTRADELIKAMRTPIEVYRDAVIEINKFREAGLLTADEQVKGITHAQEELFKTTDAAKAAKDAARDLGMTFSSAFEDAVVNGKKLTDVLSSILQDIARIILRLTVTQPIANALSNWLNPSPTTGKGSDISSSIGSSAGGALSDIFSKGWGWLKGLAGFQYGGSFTVGGAGGPDSQIVAFRATPGERVSVGGGGEAVSVNFTINANDTAGMDRLLVARRGMIVSMVQQAFDKQGKRGLRR